MKKVKKLALGIFSLLVAFGLVLGAGANFRDYNASRSVHWSIVPDDNELIDLTPLQPYAYIDNETGVLVIDFSDDNPNYPGYGSGISPASEYNFDEVFEVSNDLWENLTIVVRITSNNSHVEFYGHEGNVHKVANGAIASSSDTADKDVCFVVEPGDAVKIGLDLSANGDLPGDEWNVAMSIKAYRLGTEPAALVGKCGQP
ncbi:MAG TPA: DUF1102 domain-containing protein [Thermococcus paralvinellae]|uniref:DUF1102 domain-containing protein n=1 Tax=Thermococcus paralvinellae TaxID=582419 RepID=A0A833E2F9_9EURY|nr:DUF1102 domain-containing protein [Thermococcus paralvinellae]